LIEREGSIYAESAIEVESCSSLKIAASLKSAVERSCNGCVTTPDIRGEMMKIGLPKGQLAEAG
jgi:hypothetical protein